MKNSFCDHHILAFLDRFEGSSQPLDLLLSKYFKAHRSLGSKDRKATGTALFAMARWQGLLDHVGNRPTPKKRLDLLSRIDEFENDPSIPEHLRWGVSHWIYEKLIFSYGREKARDLCRVFGQEAPTTIRINPLKTTRDNLIEQWKDRFSIRPCLKSQYGIQFSKREPLFSLPEFKQGFFEMQDEGSQLIAELVEPKPGEHVLDYCSGSGGKTLGFAHKMQGSGQIYLHDIRQGALQQAKKRLKRSGIQNAQCLLPEHSQLKKLKSKMDWVLTDVPCSGSGTFRRNPEQKWSGSNCLKRLAEKQREIFAKALEFVKPGGIIIYATCSIFPEENEEHLKFFLENYPLELQKPPLMILPEKNGPDGFFAAVLKYISESGNLVLNSK